MADGRNNDLIAAVRFALDTNTSSVWGTLGRQYGPRILAALSAPSVSPSEDKGSSAKTPIPTEGHEAAVLGSDFTRRLEEAWTDFLDANPDDLTSPEDLPDHALVTCTQMIGIVADAVLAEQEATHQPAVPGEQGGV